MTPPMASMSILFSLLFTSFAIARAQLNQSSHIPQGSSLSPRAQQSQPTSWLSHNRLFAFGFYQQGSGFAVGIWLVGVDKATIVWTAFREEPPFKSNATLDFTEDGKLLLRTDQGQEKLIADAIDSASHASMLDYGNFVLYGIDSKIIWQSFDYLTDTILGGQTLFAGAQLFSSLTGNNHSTGRFHLKMHLDGNLVLYPINTGDTPGDAYWSSNTFVKGFKFHLYLNHTGLLVIINGTSLKSVKVLAAGSSSTRNENNTIYRATLDVDGIFRLYCHTYDDDEQSTALLKVGIKRIIKSHNPDMRKPKPPVIVITGKRAIVQIFVLAFVCTILTCVALSISGLFIFKSRVLRHKSLLESGNLGLTEVTLRLFSYNELKRATNGFKEELGKRSFGTVYKGALCKGKKLVAVKRLEKLVEEGEKQFRAEMRVIGRTHHRNSVPLLGFGAEDSKGFWFTNI